MCPTCGSGLRSGLDPRSLRLSNCDQWLDFVYREIRRDRRESLEVRVMACGIPPGAETNFIQDFLGLG